MNVEDLQKLLDAATPEPWGFGNTDEEQRMVLGDNGNGKYVCNVQIHQSPRAFGVWEEGQREANASLIALAPTLARQVIAARRLVEALNNMLSDRFPETPSSIAARAALAEWQAEQ